MSALLAELLRERAALLGVAALIALVVGVLLAPGARAEGPDERSDGRAVEQADRTGRRRTSRPADSRWAQDPAHDVDRVTGRARRSHLAADPAGERSGLDSAALVAPGVRKASVR